jgi:hypothetical protein
LGWLEEKKKKRHHDVAMAMDNQEHGPFSFFVGWRGLG